MSLPGGRGDCHKVGQTVRESCVCVCVCGVCGCGVCVCVSCVCVSSVVPSLTASSVHTTIGEKRANLLASVCVCLDQCHCREIGETVIKSGRLSESRAGCQRVGQTGKNGKPFFQWSQPHFLLDIIVLIPFPAYIRIPN